jgi:hypothetical protein
MVYRGRRRRQPWDSRAASGSLLPSAGSRQSAINSTTLLRQALSGRGEIVQPVVGPGEKVRTGNDDLLQSR